MPIQSCLPAAPWPMHQGTLSEETFTWASTEEKRGSANLLRLWKGMRLKPPPDFRVDRRVGLGPRPSEAWVETLKPEKTAMRKLGSTVSSAMVMASSARLAPAKLLKPRENRAGAALPHGTIMRTSPAVTCKPKEFCPVPKLIKPKKNARARLETL